MVLHSGKTHAVADFMVTVPSFSEARKCGSGGTNTIYALCALLR